MSDVTDWAAEHTDPLGKATDQQLIETLQGRGYLAHKPQPATTPVVFDKTRIRGDRVRIGVISDTHFGSKFQQPSYLVEHLRYMKTRKVDIIIHAGDVTDGSVHMHPGFEYELWAHGVDAQIKAAADVLVPEADRLKVPWYFIGGNHDASHYKSAGVDVVDWLCGQSEWFNYLSPDQGGARNTVGWLRFGRLEVQVSHPHMGSAYALSYKLQKWIEQLAPENKPHIVLQGNYHKVLQLDYRNVFGLLLPSYQAQSGWMASKGIASAVGSCILEVGLEPLGLSPAVQVEWLLERVPREGDWPGG